MEFRMLGPLEALEAGNPIPLGGPKQRALLALLLLNANRVVSRDRLIEELWGDRAPAEAGHSLNVGVSRLRTSLNGDGQARVVTRAPGYLLSVAPDEVDALRAERLVDDAMSAAALGSAESARDKLREAMALWRGRPLADLADEPFARAAADRLDELRLTATEELLDAELALGRHAAVIGRLEELVAEHPLRERLHGQLMLALYRSGRQAEALAAYRAARDLLAQELGVAPSPPLQELELAILRQSSSLELPRAPASPPHAAPAQAPAAPSRRWGRIRARAAVAGAAAAATATGVVVAHGGGHPARAVSLVADGVALVSRDGRPVAFARLPAAPTRLAAGAGALWVTHRDAGLVSRVDLAGRSVRQAIRVGGGPDGIAVGAGDVWVANALDGTVTRIDPGTDSVVQTIGVGRQPSDVAFAGGGVWVAHRGDGTVVRLDARTGRPGRALRTGRAPSALAGDGETLWVANQESGTVTRIDARTGAVQQTIQATAAPSAIAAGPDGIWVLNRLDATLTRIDPRSDAVTATIPVGAGADGVTAAGGAVWVAGGAERSLIKVDSGRVEVARRTLLGEAPSAVAIAGGEMWVGVRAGGARHRGGTLRLVNPINETRSIDPAVLGWNLAPSQLLGMTNDGLVTFDHVSGADGAQLVPDLAVSLPRPNDGGRSYTFRLRRGIRYSTGRTVRPSDVRRSLERLFELRSPGTALYETLVGARQCIRLPRRCDLSAGVIANDRANTVTFRLTAADPDFLAKVAQPYAFVLPATTPTRDTGQPLPATGPYVIERFLRGREIRLVRNPAFREWSRAAQPDGYPDVIVWRLGLDGERGATLVEHGDADFMPNQGPPPRRQRDVLRTRDPRLLRVNTTLITDFFFLNTRARPFDDVRVRRALNFAIDRRRVVALYGGPDNATPTCQILPPQMAGFRRLCPYTRAPSADGRWRGPDIARAQQLVAASGTKGMRVLVWDSTEPQIALDEGRYLVSLLRRLGYNASLRVLPTPAFLHATNTPATRAQVVSGGWSADYPAASDFIGKLTCANYLPRSVDASQLCDPDLDRRISRATALQAEHPQRAAALWSALDRELVRRAVWLPTVTPKVTDIVSRRVGNYQYHLLWGALVDQLWIR